MPQQISTIGDALAFVVTSTIDASFVLLSANYTTGVVSSPILNTRTTAVLTTRLRRILSRSSIPKGSFANLVRTLVDVYMVNAPEALTTASVLSGVTATLTLGVTNPATVLVGIPMSTNAPFSTPGGADSPPVDVTNYGALGDGVTDDTAAINAAVAAAVANGTRWVHFPPCLASYVVDRGDLEADGSSVLVPSNFRITGSGSSSRIKQTGVSGEDDAYEFVVFRLVAGVHDVLFEDLWFHGENGVGGAGFVASDQNAAQCIGTSVTNDVTDIVVRNCTFDDLYGHPVHAQGNPTRFHVIGCTTRWCANGINVNSNYSLQIYNTIINSEGIEATGDSILIGWNVMKNIILGGISLGGDTTENTHRRGCVVIGNSIDTCTGLGIFLSDAMVEAQVTGNSVRNAALAGIQSDTTGYVQGLGARNYGNVVTGNSVINCGTGLLTRVGIVLSGEGRHTASNNFCSSGGLTNQITGISVASPKCRVTGNYCKGDGANADILLGAGATSTFVFGNTLDGSGWIQYETGATLLPIRHQCDNATVANVIDSSTVYNDPFVLWQRTLNGAMSWGPGSAPVDTNLYRATANVLKTDDKLIAALGLGVGNSAAAATPGAVVKKMEVFDASGVSIGFIPIYDAIT